MWLITVKPSYVFVSRIVDRNGLPCYNSLEDRKPLKGNTVGSRSDTERAYIAGFLDGDGSLMLQLKTRKDTKRGFRFMATICLYQDTRHGKPLYWIRNVFDIGHVTNRNDGITELRINGFLTIRQILIELQPYIRFKELQTEALIKACHILTRNINKLSKKQLREVVDLMLVIQNENYTSTRKRTKEELLKVLDLTP